MTHPNTRPARRLAIASRLFAPEVGAAAFRLRVLADAFTAAGCAVDVLTTTPPKGSAPASDGRLNVSRWPALRDDNGYIRSPVQYLSFDAPLALRLLRRAPDFYVSEPPPTTGTVVRLVAAIRRRPYVYYAADLWSEGAIAVGASAWVVRAITAIETWVLRGARIVLAVSEEVSSRVRARGVAPERVIVVGNGIDTDVFRPDGACRTLDTPYFVYTGRMSEWQDAGVFLKALSLHRAKGHDTRALFLGQGTDLPHLRQLAERELPGVVDFLGVQPPEVTAEWIRGARAALASTKPGLGYDFAMATKVYAATACGTPVIFAGTGVTRDLVLEHGLGWATEHSPEAVAQAMDEAISDTPERPDRDHLVAWTRANASLRSAAEAAVRSVLEHVRA